MDETKKALLSIDIDTAALTQNVANAKASVSALTDQLKTLKAAGDDNTEAFAKVSEQLKKASDAADKGTDTLKDYTRGISDSTKAAADMKAGLADLSKQQGNAKDDTEKHKTSLKDYGKALIEAAEKANPVAKSIGETAKQFNAFKDVAGQVGEKLGLFKKQGDTAATNALTLSTNAGNATKGFEALKTGTDVASGGVNLFGKALADIGIGLVIIAISALIDYFKQFSPLVDACEQVTAGLSGAFNVLGRLVAGLVTPLQELFTNPKKAMTDMADFLEQNLINRFKAFGVIIDGIVHLDFKKLADGVIQLNTGVTNGTDKMLNFGKAIGAAFSETAKLKGEQQELTRNIDSESLRAAQTQAKIAELRVKAETANLADRKKYLDEIKKEEKAQADFHTANVKKGLDLALEEARIKHKLTDDEIKLIRLKGAVELDELEKSGRLFADDVKNIGEALKKSYKEVEAAFKTHKINMHKIDIEAENAEIQLQESKERVKLANIQDATQRERTAIEDDFNKRIEANKKYHALVEQLKIEKKQRLDQFDNDEIAKQKDLYDKEIEEKIKAAEGDFKKIRDLKIDQNKNDMEFDLKFLNQTEDQKEAIREKHRLIQEKVQDDYDQARLKKDKNNVQQKSDNLKQVANAENKINEDKLNKYRSYFSTLQGLFGKNTIAGKTAFLAQKAIAVAEIVVNTQKQISAINLATAYKIAADASLGLLGIPKMAADAAEGTAEVIGAIVAGALQAGTIAAATIQGFAKGGLYKSDGYGGYITGPGSGTSDSINARLSNGESIINAKSTQIFAPVLSAINEAGGGKAFNTTGNGNTFAFGGLFNASNILNDSSNELATTRTLNDMVKTMAANMPRQILVVEDVQASLQNKAMLQSMSNF